MTLLIKATHQQTKEHNRNLVLKHIFDHEAISRAELSRITRLTRTTVSEIVAELIDEGLVTEIGVGESLGGKSPILLSLAKDSRCLIGVDIAQNHVQGAVVNLRGEIKETITVPVFEHFGEKPLKHIFEILDQLVKSSCRPICGIGVGAPGLVSTSEGIVINAVNFDWKDFPLAKILQERYQLPVYIYNDCQAAAMGEYLYGGYHRKGTNLVVINVGYGIGSGIIINGKLFQGDGGGAGEIGHVVVVHEQGKPCRCGHYGCLESVASAQAIARDAKELLQFPAHLSSHELSEALILDEAEKAFIAGHPAIRDLILNSAQYLGYAIASLVGTLNIHHIVLIGEMTRFGPAWLEVIRNTMLKASLSRLANSTSIEIGKLGNHSTLLGAAALLVNNYSLLFTKNFSRTTL
ncbi:MAG: ROK family transcriptional regulator [Anaerolineales bacterium]|nr:ROK family transcriptional regulator [Anaerolineales bacterium]MCS7247469.1 ROK family transcriptional regulator [Anaerolineales bacterium]MDW8161280.1 ROK family transcriptional regulator [Anaerolineales bacterium]MDW8447289.1 ROK family transcriptional regulator [Anaerolineales bacterium]